jgi:hypothetical protein
MTVRSIPSTVSSSIRVRCRTTCRYGSAAVRCARAVAFADGWCPFHVTPAPAKEWLRRVDLPPGFDVVLPPVRRLEPVSEPSRTQETLVETGACGAPIIHSRFKRQTIDEYLEKLEALAESHAAIADG